MVDCAIRSRLLFSRSDRPVLSVRMWRPAGHLVAFVGQRMRRSWRGSARLAARVEDDRIIEVPQRAVMARPGHHHHVFFIETRPVTPCQISEVAPFHLTRDADLISTM